MACGPMVEVGEIDKRGLEPCKQATNDEGMAAIEKQETWQFEVWLEASTFQSWLVADCVPATSQHRAQLIANKNAHRTARFVQQKLQYIEEDQRQFAERYRWDVKI